MINYIVLPLENMSGTREQAVKAQQTYDHDLDKLWDILKKSTPEQAERIMSQLDEKTVTALRTKKNPFGKPVFKNTRARGTRLLAFNVINLTEKYLQRLAMTGLIGFIYRMLDEYEPEESKQFPSEDDAEFGSLYVAKVAELKRTRPGEIYTNRAREITARVAELRASDTDTDVSAELRKLAKESFAVRTKLFKYNLQLLKTEEDELKEKIEMLDVEADNMDRSAELIGKSIPELEKCITKKAAYDEAVSAYLKANPDTAITVKIRDGFANDQEMSLEDAESKNENQYRKEIANSEHSIVINKEQAAAKRTESDVMKNQLHNVETAIAKHGKSLADLKIEYSKKFKSTVAVPAPRKGRKTRTTVTTTAHPLDKIVPEPYEPTDDDIDVINLEVKAELGVDRTREEHTEYLQDIIQKFLDQYLVYNPDTHVQCAYKPNYEDPLRTPLELDEHRRIVEEEYERRLVPPDDTFFRWNRYLENNYEEIRQATDDIYGEKSDFEFDIVPLEVFEGPDAETEAGEFDRKHTDEVEADILRATFGVHNLMGAWAQNREKRDFYNENTEIIKRIINENEESQKFGRKLNKQRAEEKKAANIAESGQHAKGLGDYKKTNPTALRDHGVTEISEIPTEDIIPRDDGKLGDNEVEIGVTEIRPVRRRGGRRGFRGTGEQWKFHVPEEKLNPENVKIGRPSAVHKKLGAEERAAEDAALDSAF